MNFEERARKAYERGDTIRSVVVLVEGLKHRPHSPSALQLLLNIYGDEIEHPGLEGDVLRALVNQPEAPRLLGHLVVRLEQRACDAMVRELVLLARERGLEVVRPANVAPPVDEHDVEPASKPESAIVEQVASIEAPANASAAVPFEGAEGADGSAADDGGVPAATDSDEGRALLEPTNDRSLLATTLDGPTARRLRIENRRVGARGNRVQASRPSARGLARTVLLVVVGAAVLLGAGFAGYRGLNQAHFASRIARLDALLEDFDPEHLETFDRALDELAWHAGQGEPHINERRAFAHTVVHFEARAPEPLVTNLSSQPQTPWGQAALVFEAMHADDLERALTEATRLERTYPYTLGAEWTRGRLCEHRGDLECAREHYLAIVRDHERFVPAHMGLVRISARRMDGPRLEQHVRHLQSIAPNHAYGALSLETLGAMLDPNIGAGKGAREGAPTPDALPANVVESRDRFVQAAVELVRAKAALERGEPGVAREAAARAVAHDPTLGPAVVLVGLLDAAHFEIERARDYFLRAAKIDQASGHLRTLVQAVAPLSLASAGRPDIGMMFSVPGHDFELDGSRPASSSVVLMKRRERQRPAALVVDPTGAVEHDPAARQALLARAQAMILLGAGDLVADQMLVLDTHEDVRLPARLATARASVVQGQQRAARRAIAGLGKGVERDIAEATLAHVEGRYADAIAHGQAALEKHPDHPLVLRPLVLSYLASGRSRDAVALVEAARVPLLWQPEVDSLRLRVYARLGQRSDVLDALYTRLGALEPTSVPRLVDLAVTAFWLRRMDDAQRFAALAIELSEANPEANWIMGLILRVEGDAARARQHFRRALRGDENNPALLVELGHIYLDLKRYAAAQEAFYAAVLRDRHNIEALRGLGEAYLEHDVVRGRRDLARMAANYRVSLRNAAPIGELLKWLGVLHGSRRGDEAALAYLEQAEQHLGQRADLVVEVARYHEARGESDVARQRYVEALQRNAMLPDAHFGLAQIALRSGEHRVARDHLERFLTLRPHGARTDAARTLLERLRTTHDPARTSPTP